MLTWAWLIFFNKHICSSRNKEIKWTIFLIRIGLDMSSGTSGLIRWHAGIDHFWHCGSARMFWIQLCSLYSTHRWFCKLQHQGSISAASTLSTCIIQPLTSTTRMELIHSHQLLIFPSILPNYQTAIILKSSTWVADIGHGNMLMCVYIFQWPPIRNSKICVGLWISLHIRILSMLSAILGLFPALW